MLLNSLRMRQRLMLLKPRQMLQLMRLQMLLRMLLDLQHLLQFVVLFDLLDMV
jgi:hypothetical protein